MKRWRGLPLLVLLFGLSGCGPEKVVVTHRPIFDFEGINRLAVVKFADPPGVPGAGEIISQKISTVLVQNMHYRGKLYDRQNIREIINEEDFGQTGRVDPATAAKIGKLTGVSTLLVGRVNSYGVQSQQSNSIKNVTDWGWVNGYYVPVGSHGVPITIINHDATVDVTIHVVDATTGQTLWSDNKRGSFSDKSNSSGKPPKHGAQELLAFASDHAVNEILKGLIVWSEEVKVPKDSLLTYRELLDGQWNGKGNQYSNLNEKFYVVVALHNKFHGANIRMRIKRKGNEGALVYEDSVEWDSEKFGTYGFTISPADILEKAGPGDYEAIYYVNGIETRKMDLKIKKIEKKKKK